MAVVEPSSSLEILVRGPEGFFIWNGPPFPSGEPGVKLDRVPCTSAKFSDDGSKLMVTKSDSVISIFDCKTLTEIRSFDVPNVLAAVISPCGTYLQTFQKCSSPQHKNVVLWKIENGESAYQLFQKNMTKVTWPSVHFSSDETVACRLATNEIQFFDPRDFSKGFVNRLRVPGVAALELSKAPGSYVAAFVPESKGMPASVQIYACGKDLQSQPVARRSFFRCSTVQLSWNSGSTGLLVVVQSDVDKTNQSYYGESKLNYLTTDGAHEGLVPLRKEGPIHDVQWSYSGKEFAVVYGFMPAMATVFDKKCNPLLELGTGPYNTIRWNPLGNFICLAGFGNLPGDMAFWDYREKKQLGTTRAELSVTSEWSPDGRYFMTATTAPRLQVDNGVKVFHHNGSLYFKKMFDRLYQVDWKPESVEKFGDIEDLVKAVGSVKIDEAKVPGKGSKATQAVPKPTQVVSKAAQAVPKATPANPPAAKPAAYRPPHAKAAAVVQAELFGGSPSGELSKNALKNKKKREKKKQAEAASAAGGS
ncbi:uncharacterized protein LOC125842352 [Solanum stenotomum]|uniref:uncharacterized protein LOC125842352 n=1 Tax=Solanum stenotomum TaxID=172797 RepID=UPI0020D03D86|nr:uncharacterized protein LOC125842352 [Solanum stenotomum]XP_049377587.1 uncharacterized protein LOC125842352 [Solanum stenotomum]XP_049377588.1 uncharacterized protein LOC125842352 [Solanum stenotomum]XP_049377589.1 uncharacterized protein LOC125842352 [Solanum stenotomum]